MERAGTAYQVEKIQVVKNRSCENPSCEK